MIDRDNSIFHIANLEFPVRKDPRVHLSNTLLDGVSVAFFLPVVLFWKCDPEACSLETWLTSLYVDLFLFLYGLHLQACNVPIQLSLFSLAVNWHQLKSGACLSRTVEPVNDRSDGGDDHMHPGQIANEMFYSRCCVPTSSLGGGGRGLVTYPRPVIPGSDFLLACLGGCGSHGSQLSPAAGAHTHESLSLSISENIGKEMLVSSLQIWLETSVFACSSPGDGR